MSEPFKSWAILELLGHRRLGGMVSEVEMFGGKMARIDIPDTSEGAAPDKVISTQHYSQAAIYGCHPCTEEVAREAAKWCQPERPAVRMALPAPRDYSEHNCPTCDEECGCGAMDAQDCTHKCALPKAAETTEEPQDTCAPYDGLTAHATACTGCPTKLPPEWRVREQAGAFEYSLVCCMCGRQTEWTKDWSGLVDWWCTNNPALPDGTKAP